MAHLVLLAVVLSSLYLAHGGLPPKSPCPDGWSYCPAASRCYKLTDGAFTQPEALSQCRKLGGSLATIDSAEATQCLLDYAGKSSREATSAWIGLVDKSENSKHTANCTCWKWLDGAPFSYENFAPGQPNNAEAKEWCTEVFLPGSNYPAGTWNDELCEAYKRPAVCSVPAKPTPATPGTSSTRPTEPSTLLSSSTSARPTPRITSVVTPTTPTKTSASTTCPAGWSSCPGASHCYKLVAGGYTQPEAQSKCRELGGILATVDTAAANQCLIDYANKTSQEATSAWIGLLDKEENSKHTANCTCWKWLDGASFKYENFAPGQPNNAEAKEWCTEVFLPGSNYPAGTWNDELCDAYKRPAMCSVPAIPRPSTGGPTSAGPPKTSALPASTTPSTNEPPCPCELGSTPAGPPKRSTLRPSPKPAGQSRATTKKVKASTSTTTTPCPAGWFHCPTASKCYKLVGNFTQPKAQRHCQKLGGNLATVSSAAASKCLIDYAKKTSPKAQAAWLGLVDRKHNVRHTANCTCWKWLDGTPYKYENFAPGEPKNARKTEWCTAIFLPRSTMPVGTWNDLRCETHTRPALCSMPSKKPVARPTPARTPKSSTPRSRRTPAGTPKPRTRRASAKPARTPKPATRRSSAKPAKTPKPATRRVSPRKGRPTPPTASHAKTTKRHVKPKPAKETCEKQTTAVPLFRAYQYETRDHFYTTKPGEFASAKKNHGYKDEGITGRILPTKTPKSTELYRLYHEGNHDHFYTTYKEERDNAINKLGYKDEKIVGYVYKTSNGKCPCAEVRPLYRMYNGGAVDHFYTMDAAEKANAIGKLGYSDEGIVACIYPAK